MESPLADHSRWANALGGRLINLPICGKTRRKLRIFMASTFIGSEFAAKRRSTYGRLADSCFHMVGQVRFSGHACVLLA